jgi:hypothetical protein
MSEGPEVTTTSSTVSAMYSKLQRTPPEVDYDEWQQHLSAGNLEWARRELWHIAKAIEDCTKHPWRQHPNNYYAFPPPLLTRILIEKAAAEEQTLILVSHRRG